MPSALNARAGATAADRNGRLGELGRSCGHREDSEGCEAATAGTGGESSRFCFRQAHR